MLILGCVDDIAPLKNLLEGMSSVAFEPRHEKTCLRGF